MQRRRTDCRGGVGDRPSDKRSGNWSDKIPASGVCQAGTTFPTSYELLASAARGGATLQVMFTTGEASRILGVTAQTVINWIESGKLPAVRVGRGRRRIAVTSLASFVRENAIPAQDNAPDLWERLRVQAPAEETDLPAVIAIDGRAKVVFWNDRAESLLGWTSLERVGKPISDIPAKVPGLPVDLAELAREPGEEMRLSLHLELGRRDGGLVRTETTLSWIRDAKGRSIGTVYLVEPVPDDSRTTIATPGSKARGRQRSRRDAP